MVEPAYDLEAAVEAWLRAYSGYQNYLKASENLYTVFAHSWHGSRRSLAEAFDAFRQDLAREHGCKLLEVNSINPNDRSRVE